MNAESIYGLLFDNMHKFQEKIVDETEQQHRKRAMLQPI